uniref:(northern house mosquito) hypothetical protein n=1 Tax=Culex pipiens TaxID=7175 RepID=A0A8D8GGB8_CULPI
MLHWPETSKQPSVCCATRILKSTKVSSCGTVSTSFATRAWFKQSRLQLCSTYRCTVRKLMASSDAVHCCRNVKSGVCSRGKITNGTSGSVWSLLKVVTPPASTV